MKVVLWQTAYLGDVVLTTPLLRSLLRHKLEVTFVGRPFCVPLLEGYNVNIIPFDKGLRSSFSMLEVLEGHHVAITPHRSMRTALILFFSRIPVRVGFDKSELPFLYTHLVKHSWHMHEVERNLTLLKPIGIVPKEEDRLPLLFVREEEVQRVRKLYRLPQRYVVLSPFSQFPLKEWDLQNWVKLAKSLDIPVVITGAEKDRARASVFDRVGINLVGKTGLREFMAVLKGAELVISCDSSAVHVANALGVPAITVYTSTSPAYGFYPLIGTYVTPQLSCSPCSPNPKRCKTGSYACLKDVSWDKVLYLSYSLMTEKHRPNSIMEPSRLDTP
ncbi:glycosyl transferase family 9 [Thermocrinis albus DSM 14484]|uniref:Glycosyl transferase family 9 n=1 Tax=Thermocrinis albus (strain DSM 14484 / JCM 11386 / HI 11/12) TaxID=638303 RepID=D3SLT0_THEAH|nr:glycosyltransferase family 9 protein [Thermocrinis albus]ADC89710.1 glycosyl transferase family 9 [Thermocrinis albus DSM 14484]